MTRLLLLALPLALTACAPTAQDFANECAGYGFQRDDPRFPQCVMLVQQHHQEQQERAAMMLGQMGQAMQSRAAAEQQARPMTTCNAIGNQMTCW